MDPWFRIGMFVRTEETEDGNREWLCDVGRSRSFEKADARATAINNRLAELGLLTYEDDEKCVFDVEVGRTFAMFY